MINSLGRSLGLLLGLEIFYLCTLKYRLKYNTYTELCVSNNRIWILSMEDGSCLPSETSNLLWNTHVSCPPQFLQGKGSLSPCGSQMLCRHLEWQAVYHLVHHGAHHLMSARWCWDSAVHSRKIKTIVLTYIFRN